MKNLKITPGPWEIRSGRSVHEHEIVGPKREAICATHNWLKTDPVEESRANARAISAVPDIIYSGLRLLEAMNNVSGLDTDVRDAAKRVELAQKEFESALKKGGVEL